MLTLPSFQSTFAKTNGSEIIHQGPKPSVLFSSLDKILTGIGSPINFQTGIFCKNLISTKLSRIFYTFGDFRFLLNSCPKLAGVKKDVKKEFF